MQEAPTPPQELLPQLHRFTWKRLLLWHWMPLAGVGFLLALLLASFLFFLVLKKALVLQRMLDASQQKVPSRVYARADQVQVGDPMTPEELIHALERLGYTPDASLSQTGRYHVQNRTLSIFLRDAPLTTGRRTGYPVRVEWENSTVARITNQQTQKEEDSLTLEPQTIATLYDSFMEERSVVPLEEVPPSLIHCLLVAEDQSFFEHSGVDPIGMTRASLNNLQEKRLAQGGSTLTQQLIRTLFLTRERTWQRKRDEIILAFLLEHTRSKEEILQLFVNECYLGQDGPINLRGFAGAARYYFNTDLRCLTLAQSALLVALLPGPNLYNPYHSPDRVKQRRDWILGRLAEAGLDSTEPVQRALQEPLPTRFFSFRKEQLFFVDSVLWNIGPHFPAQDLQTGGYHIFTTLRMDWQELAETSVQTGLQKLEEQYPDLKKADSPLEAASLCLDPHTGAILTMVGGRSLRSTARNRVLWARRPIGSLIKPFFYLYALQPSPEGEYQYQPNTLLDDSPFSLTVGTETWNPENYSHRYAGPVTLRKALEQSLNIPVIRLSQQMGLSRFQEYFQSLGIDCFEPVPSAPLGTLSLSPYEVARLYTLFPNRGQWVTPYLVESVRNQSFQPVFQSVLRGQEAASEPSTYQILSMLEGVMKRGTAQSAAPLGWKGIAAGKTGSTSRLQDSWFVGMTPDLVTLVWVGFDRPRDTGLSGREGALPLWVDFMSRLYPQGNQKPFPVPAGLVTQTVHYDSGRIVQGQDTPGVTEYFQPSSVSPRAVLSPTQNPSPTPKSAPVADPTSLPAPALVTHATPPSPVPPPKKIITSPTPWPSQTPTPFPSQSHKVQKRIDNLIHNVFTGNSSQGK